MTVCANMMGDNMSQEIIAIITFGIGILIQNYFMQKNTRQEVEDKIVKRIDKVEESLSQKIDGVEESLSKRIDALSGKVATLDLRLQSIETRVAVIESRINGIEGLLARIPWYLGHEQIERLEK